MKSYASFRKCDLQVHSPRDPNWRGPRPCGLKDKLALGALATEADVEKERRRWANDLVETCAAKGVRAIAITDHHDVVMAGVLQEEVASRVAAGNPPDLWVFPGMELTVRDGVQCIILFDADLEKIWWTQAQGALGIVHAQIDPLASVAADPVQLPLSYDELSVPLDEIQGLKGRYIILPNVSQGGQHTVVRNGWHARFRKMRYVGGYLDAGQRLSSCNGTHKQRLSGSDVNWGDRFIYPLPTSDSRDAGTHSSGRIMPGSNFLCRPQNRSGRLSLRGSRAFGMRIPPSPLSPSRA